MTQRDDEAMRTHVGLLSGVNLGKHNTLAMSDLRDIVTGLGFRDVATYIRSGNVVFSCPERGAVELAANWLILLADGRQAEFGGCLPH